MRFTSLEKVHKLEKKVANLQGVIVSMKQAANGFLDKVKARSDRGYRKENCEAARDTLLNLQNSVVDVVEIDVMIPSKFHNSLFVIHPILRQLPGGVAVSFPKVEPNSAKVIIEGPPECVDAAKQSIASIVEELSQRDNIDVVIEQKHHRTIMGSGGSKVKQIQSDHNVDIKFSERAGDERDGHHGGGAEHTPEQNGDGIRASDIIRVSGRPENCEGAKAGLLEQVPITVEVDIPFKIIGKQGAVIGKIRDQFNVNIQLPRDDDQDVIIITGYEADANSARDEILGIVNELVEREKFREEVEIDHRVHSRIIGHRGQSVRQIMKDFNVDIRFSRSDSANPNLVVISGGVQDRVYDARDELLNLEEEYIQDVTENEYMDSSLHAEVEDEDENDKDWGESDEDGDDEDWGESDDEEEPLPPVVVTRGLLPDHNNAKKCYIKPGTLVFYKIKNGVIGRRPITLEEAKKPVIRFWSAPLRHLRKKNGKTGRKIFGFSIYKDAKVAASLNLKKIRSAIWNPSKKQRGCSYRKKIRRGAYYRWGDATPVKLYALCKYSGQQVKMHLRNKYRGEGVLKTYEATTMLKKFGSHIDREVKLALQLMDALPELCAPDYNVFTKPARVSSYLTESNRTCPICNGVFRERRHMLAHVRNIHKRSTDNMLLANKIMNRN